MAKIRVNCPKCSASKVVSNPVSAATWITAHMAMRHSGKKGGK